MPPQDLAIEDCISFLAGKAYQKINKRARTLLAPFNVTPVQYALLSVLWDLDSQSSAELGERLILDSATMTGLLDRAETLGLIERKKDVQDRRIGRICLTAKGRELKAPLTEAIALLNMEVTDLLGKNSPQLNAHLKKIANLD